MARVISEVVPSSFRLLFFVIITLSTPNDFVIITQHLVLFNIRIKISA
jgi:hypothetical protein